MDPLLQVSSVISHESSLEHLPGPYILLTGLLFPVSLLGDHIGDFTLLLSEGESLGSLVLKVPSIPTNQAILECTVCHMVLCIWHSLPS